MLKECHLVANALNLVLFSVAREIIFRWLLALSVTSECTPW